MIIVSGSAVEPTPSKVSSVEKVPVRATILSALSVVPYVIVLTTIYGFDLTVVQRGSAIRFLFHILDTIRCPLTALVTFVSNKSNGRRSALADVRQRRNEGLTCNEPSFSL